MRGISDLLEIGTPKGSDVYFQKHCVTKKITEERLVESENKVTEFLLIVRESRYLPETKNPKESFERLKEWSGQLVFEHLKHSFLEFNNHNLTQETLLFELQCINDFINEAKKSSSFEACASNYHQTSSKDNPRHEYLRICEGYYLINECDYSLNEITARVYAKYFLFKKWLENLLQDTHEYRRKSQIQSDVSKSKPAVIVIALYYYYLQETGAIPYFENHPKGKTGALDEIAKEYHISTKRLQLKYNFIQNSTQNRIAANQVENIKATILLLRNYTNAKELASKELALAEKM